MWWRDEETCLLDFVYAVHVAKLDRLLLEWFKLCGASSGLEEARVFQQNRQNDQHDWEWIREGEKMGQVTYRNHLILPIRQNERCGG